jgi:hypothetical protein
MAINLNTELTARLDKVIQKGFAEISYYEMLTWSNQSRFTYTLWRNIAQSWYFRLDELQIIAPGDKSTPLLTRQTFGADGCALIWGKNLRTIGPYDDLGWIDIRVLAKLPMEAPTEEDLKPSETPPMGGMVGNDKAGWRTPGLTGGNSQNT